MLWQTNLLKTLIFNTWLTHIFPMKLFQVYFDIWVLAGDDISKQYDNSIPGGAVMSSSLLCPLGWEWLLQQQHYFLNPSLDMTGNGCWWTVVRILNIIVVSIQTWILQVARLTSAEFLSNSIKRLRNRGIPQFCSASGGFVQFFWD